MKTALCPICNTTFSIIKHFNQECCSKKCAGIKKSKKIMKFCPTCQNTFKQKNVSQKYCSYNCARKGFGWRKGKIFTKYQISCKICGKIFDTVPTSSNQITCSRKCGGKNRRKWPILKKCIICNKDFFSKKASNLYCSRSCGNRKYISNLKKMFPVPRTIPQTTRMKLRSSRGNTCEKCGWFRNPGILEIHHKDRDRKNNDLKNLQVLCPNCHSAEHYHAKDGNYGFKKKKTIP